MYCNYCGRGIPDDAVVCPYCAKQVGGAVPRAHLTRPRMGRKLGGVCLGFARYLDVDVTLVRVIWILAVIFTIPLAIIGYIVAWIVIPEEPELLPAAGETVTNP